MNDVLREKVRDRYAEAALRGSGGARHEAGCGCGGGADGCCGGGADGCCGGATAGIGFGEALYSSAERQSLPEAAVLASLGCGNPTAVADLHSGEVVLDLGSGGGIDVLLSARRVGPTGTAYGVDMTDEMLALAERNREEAGVTNAVFLKGEIEAVPLPDSAVDVIISNCVVNLSTDKPRVFSEMARVLKPGGRIGITDVVADDSLTPAQRAERGSFVGCIAGALSFTEYRTVLETAGFNEVAVTPTHSVAAGMHSATIRASRPN